MRPFVSGVCDGKVRLNRSNYQVIRSLISCAGAPRDARLVFATGGTLVFDYTPPFDDGGSPVTGYTASLYEKVGLSTTSLVAVNSSASMAISFGGLAANTNYTCVALRLLIVQSAIVDIVTSKIAAVSRAG